MSSSNEVFLGQKKAVARYNMDTKEAVWSRAVEDTPYIITTCGDNILVQSMNSWQTKKLSSIIKCPHGQRSLAHPGY
jgi:hypothetical protein|tara:strand:+ start:58 stop:288 length:231 start_codon:yes stop_codon:yes gene_type:complete